MTKHFAILRRHLKRNKCKAHALSHGKPLQCYRYNDRNETAIHNYGEKLSRAKDNAIIAIVHPRIKNSYISMRITISERFITSLQSVEEQTFTSPPLFLNHPPPVLRSVWGMKLHSHTKQLPLAKYQSRKQGTNPLFCYNNSKQNSTISSGS